MEAGHVLEAGLCYFIFHGDLRAADMSSRHDGGTPLSNLELAIVVVRHDDARKQIFDDREEQRDVVR